MEGNEPPKGIKTTTTLFTIIESMYDRAGASVADIAEDVGMAKSTVHTHLTTLEREGYVVKSGEEYYIGLEFLKFGGLARRTLTDAAIVQPTLDRLCEETGHVVWYVVPEHNEAVFVSNALGKRAVRTLGRIGFRMELHCLAEGKAILAQMDDEAVERILDEKGLPRKTENTITDREQLFADLESIRTQGFATSNSEANEGVRAVAAPVSPEEPKRGAISIVAPRNQLRGSLFSKEYPDLVKGAANEIELKLAYPE